MIRARSLAALALSVALAGGSAACAQSVAMQGGGDDVIRTVRTEAPAASSPPLVLPTTAETFDAVSSTLDAAAEAWSSGDVDAVMATYVADEPLLVFLGDTPLKGPDAVRSALQARAAQPGGLGVMTYEWFETLQFDVNTTVVSGRVVLRRNAKTSRGLFTRVLRRTPDGWRIVHDQLAWGADA
ncbi:MULTISPECIES: YybH family protein [unclassified Brevundimonas]|uniref:YybH family protein n=1 Tax=unclassified Brevundimonas TaxID=2622653 RepID=UPI003F920046